MKKAYSETEESFQNDILANNQTTIEPKQNTKQLSLTDVFMVHMTQQFDLAQSPFCINFVIKCICYLL